MITISPTPTVRPILPITEAELMEIWKHSDGGEYQAISKALIEKGVVIKQEGRKFWNFSHQFHIHPDKLNDLRRIARLLHEDNLFEMKIKGSYGGGPIQMIEIKFQHLQTLSLLRLYCGILDIHDIADERKKKLLSFTEEELQKIEL